MSQSELKNWASFCESSLKWCSNQSEESIVKVHDVINLIVEDSARVSALSEEAESVVKSMHDLIDSVGDGDREASHELALALQVTAKGSHEVQVFAEPMIQALQFHDRLSQNMGNLSGMITKWQEYRECLAEKDCMTTSDKEEFGEAMLKHTTMPKERDIVRSTLGMSEAEEEVAESSVLLF
ncbi:MAG: hypothetical protein AB8C84_01740 [Oligoflexales bacterium]